MSVELSIHCVLTHLHHSRSKHLRVRRTQVFKVKPVLESPFNIPRSILEDKINVIPLLYLETRVRVSLRREKKGHTQRFLGCGVESLQLFGFISTMNSG